jgi:hypothetical protein
LAAITGSGIVGGVKHHQYNVLSSNFRFDNLKAQIDFGHTIVLSVFFIFSALLFNKSSKNIIFLAIAVLPNSVWQLKRKLLRSK